MRRIVLLGLALVLSACGAAHSDDRPDTAAPLVGSTTVPSTTMPSSIVPSTMPSSTMPSSTMPSSTMPSSTMPSSTMPSSTTTALVPIEAPRAVAPQAWVPFATIATGRAANVVLHNPSQVVERVGFHQAAHDGAQQMEVLAGAVAPLTLEDRERNTGDRTAADVVSHPSTEIRAPVTGTVIRASTYTLYCKYQDSYVVIEPDARPGWEVKVLHITGLQVQPYQRVEAGVTPIAAHPTQLPFPSQVDKHRTAEPAWPHVHIEVIDPGIPNLPSPGEGC